MTEFRPEVFGERTWAIPEGAEIKPWWFFERHGLADGEEWQVWCGSDDWVDVREGLPETGLPSGLMLIVRYVEENNHA